MRQVLFWRRTDVQGMERLALAISPDGITAHSTVLCEDEGGYRIDHHWRLDPQWRALSVTVERWSTLDHGVLLLERAGSGWCVDGAWRADLDGAEEPDLSVTPFCNTFPILRTPRQKGESLTIDTAFINGPALTVNRSRQRYERQEGNRLRYVDLGLSQGFEADLEVDRLGLVLRYQHLFERIEPSGEPS